MAPGPGSEGLPRREGRQTKEEKESDKGSRQRIYGVDRRNGYEVR